MSIKTVEQPLVDDTITTSGSVPLSAKGADALVVVVDVTAAPTGTSPSLTFSLEYIDPNTGTAYALAATSGAFAAITAQLASPQRVVFDPVYDENLQLVWTVSGTTPSFAGVSVAIVSIERSPGAV